MGKQGPAWGVEGVRCVSCGVSGSQASPAPSRPFHVPLRASAGPQRAGRLPAVGVPDILGLQGCGVHSQQVFMGLEIPGQEVGREQGVGGAG